VQTVAETSIFQKRAVDLLSEDERVELLNFLAENPEAGDVITDTGGVKKLRFSAKGRGKSGGVRVIYYFYDETILIYALLIYGKNERADLTPSQRKNVAKLAAKLKAIAKRQ